MARFAAICREGYIGTVQEQVGTCGDGSPYILGVPELVPKPGRIHKGDFAFAFESAFLEATGYQNYRRDEGYDEPAVAIEDLDTGKFYSVDYDEQEAVLPPPMTREKALSWSELGRVAGRG